MSANIVAQVVGIVSFLLLPNLLSVEDFAIVVYINIILYYATFTDIGIKSVYSRMAPGMLAKGLEGELIAMEDSVQFFWQITTFIFSCAAICIFYLKFGSFLDALLFGTIINLSSLVTFHIAKKVARGGFPEYKGLNIVKSLSSLACLPAAYFAALTGWLWGSVLAFFMLFAYVRDKKIWSINVSCNPFTHIRLAYEGIYLSANQIVWGTLLMISRLYAALIFSGKLVAVYGVVHTGFSIVSSAIIAICLPVSRETFYLCGKSGAEAKGDVLWFVFRIQVGLVMVVTFLSYVSADIAPLMFEFFFKKYDFDPLMIKIIVMSTIAIPFLVTSGAVFVGHKMLKRYIFTLLSVLSLSWLFLYETVNIFGDLTPAATQLIFLCVAGISLTVLLWASFSSRTVASLFIFTLPIALTLFILLTCFSIKYLSFSIFQGELASIICADLFIMVLFASSLLLIKRKAAIFDNLKAYYIEKAGLA